MLVDHDRRLHGAPPDGTYGAGAYRPRDSALRRFLGGSPTGVFLRLLFLSVLVGAFMAMLGMTPGRLFWHVYDSARALIDVGLASLHDFGGWIVAGAIVVVPLWLIARLVAVSR
ncbi:MULTISPECIES: DUF6460 domain-containing protein [Methylobacterium]|uniref:DUF6460 domain-containing protein n=1 Tax=Methylobacterium longum TaxID=767694 RepID=A0ABT8B067_9HYPH|nr:MULTISPECIES: DUF6460 domain-containing protein [Methylobacterium]MCJ2098230.1 DUF6460 domain-containing protein [Methylobacterium sp. E-046]MDN3574904.1 DUF6460 domain-containing protein [Methylobacterium longum]GJE13084.1 hypothetical protein FOHLNKBM_4145 [Methylobacterium longum]